MRLGAAVDVARTSTACRSAWASPAEEDLARERGATAGAGPRARVAARRLIREHDLPMKVVAIDYVDRRPTCSPSTSAPRTGSTSGRSSATWRALRARVELRQIGPRDEARVQGGIGPCGRDLCCATFLKDFEPVSVRMAKDQDLPVNPMRISGACGRLMCCLKYEHPLYQEFKADAPRTGTQVETAEGAGTVVGHNVPVRQRGGPAGGRRQQLRLLRRQRVRLPQGLRDHASRPRIIACNARPSRGLNGRSSCVPVRSIPKEGEPR